MPGPAPTETTGSSALATTGRATTGGTTPAVVISADSEDAGDDDGIVTWNASAANGVTPDYLIPRMREEPVSPPAYYRRLFIYDIDSPADHASTIGSVIDPFDAAASAPAQRPAIGVLLTHEQAWYEEGLALGRLNHSVCLAPGEVTKVAVVDWQSRTSASETAATSQEEGIRAATDQNQHVQAVQQAVAHEAQNGSSATSSISNQTQAGANASGLFFGASGSTASSVGLGMTVSHSAGERDLAANSAREVHQRTEETSNSVRSRRATQVREISQSETSTATSRVVANYNHMHAMTVMYFEVLQVFSLTTRVIEAERCIFLPMKAIDFDSVAIERHQELLLSILSSLGQDALCHSIVQFLDTKRDLLKEAKDLEAQLPALEKAAETATAASQDAIVRYAAAQRAGGGSNFMWEVAQAYAAWQRMLAQATIAAQALAQARAKYASLRAGAELAVRDVSKILQKMKLLLNQHMWMRVEPHVWHQIVLDKVHGSPKPESLGGRMDPHPLGVFGNYVAFRWPTDDPKFRSTFVRNGRAGAPISKVALPSGGLFAEAVLGQANAAEKIDLTRFWNWKDSPIPILPPDMQPLSLASRARDVTFASFDFAPVVAQLKDQKMPDDDIEKVLGAIKESMFRDQSGMETLSKQLIQQAISNAAGATSAGAQALDAVKSARSFVVDALNSEAAKTLSGAAAKTIAPEGEGASMIGGLMNAAGGKGKPAAEPAEKKPAGKKKPAAKT